MIDLNNPDTYSVQDFGGGNILYKETSTGLYYDPSDLSSPLSSADLAAYGAPAGTSGAISPASSTGTQTSQSSYNSAATTATANSPSSGGVNFSGMGGLFTAIGSAFATKINPPKTTVGGQPLVFNAATGGYIPASSAGASLTNLSQTPMWLIIGLVVLALVIAFAMRRKE